MPFITQATWDDLVNFDEELFVGTILLAPIAGGSCFVCLKWWPDASSSVVGVCIFIILLFISFVTTWGFLDGAIRTFPRFLLWVLGKIVQSRYLRWILWVLAAPFILIILPFWYCFHDDEEPGPVEQDHVFSPQQILDWLGVDSRPPSCRLCQSCSSIVSRSRLLAGISSRYGFSTDGVERYDHLTIRSLYKSAQTCHLCQLLWLSLKRRRRDRAFEHLLQFSSTSKSLPPPECINNTSTNDQNGYGTFRPADRYFQLKLWEEWEEWSTQSPTLWMQFAQYDIPESRPLKIEKLPYSHAHEGDCSLLDTVNSAATMRWAENQIDTCCKSHSYCQTKFVPEGSTSYRPKRLLDVQEANSSNILLIETSELGIGSLDYVALSHCWGGMISMMLLEKNRETLRSIEIGDLPRNFLDAVTIARQINIRYLWIDSLCIQQDSMEEWEAESGNMGLIYANAKCIISATASENSNGGCFVWEDSFAGDCALSTPNGLSYIVQSGTYKAESSLFSLIDKKVEAAPLNTRAWAFQERFLASRVLHFCDGLVIFECNTHLSSQQHGDMPYRSRTFIRADGTPHSPIPAIPKRVKIPIPEVTASQTVREKYQVRQGGSVASPLHPISRPARKGKLVTKYRSVSNPRYYAQVERRRRAEEAEREAVAAERRQQRQAVLEWEAKITRTSARTGMRGAFEYLARFSGTTDDGIIEFHNRWYEMVEKYSIRKLTYDADKMKALAGVAYFIQENTRLEYVAGLWSHEQEHNRMLQVNLLWACTHPQKDRILLSVPTWSWGSINGRITSRLQPPNYSDSSIYATNDTRGRAREETSSKWRDVQWLIRELKSKAINAKRPSNSLIENATLTLEGCLYDFNRFKVDYLPDLDDGGATTTTTTGLLCLPILSFTNTDLRPQKRPRQAHGIALRAKPDEEDGYERTGYFWTANVHMAKELSGGTQRKSIRLF
ncbi:heterokaryon incompatibility protein-domain-containing protein [Xylogone sp. PMI_703]|nr:heterokaryon incompatibility protein-domain-containing protein [Xylogone sp. PMI_703]